MQYRKQNSQSLKEEGSMNNRMYDVLTHSQATLPTTIFENEIEQVSTFTLLPKNPGRRKGFREYKVKELYLPAILLIMAVATGWYTGILVSTVNYPPPNHAVWIISAWSATLFSLIPGWLIVYCECRMLRNPAWDAVKDFPYLSLFQLGNALIAIHISCLSLALVIRVEIGGCDDSYPPGPGRWSCNPTGDIGAIPELHLMMMMLSLPLLQVAMKCHNYVVIFVSWLISFSATVASMVISKSSFSYPAIVLLLFPLIMSYDYERQMVRCFIAKENLHSSVLVTLRLEHEKKLAEVSKKEMQYVMGNVAHDLKTPMQAICLGIDDIGRLSKPDDITTVDTRSDDVLSEIHGMLQILRDTSNFMVLSINRAVDFTKTSSGVELKPNIESVDIPEILEWTVNCMRRLQDHVPIVLDPFPAGMGSRVFTDRGWLIDNMLCLLSNAVKYTMQGEVHVFVAIEDRPFPLGSQKWLKVTVMDTGIGIPSERKSALFQPFSQAQRMAGGTGLGLYSLSKRMNALGGDCGVCDRGDGTEGSCFWFCFHYIPDFLDEDDVTEDIRSRYRFSATPPLPSHNTETNGVEVGLSPSLEVERPPSLDVSIAEEFDNHKQDDVVKGSGTSDIESSHMISGVLDDSVDLSARILDMKLIPPSPPLHCAPAAPPESEDIRGGEENESYDKTYEVLLVDDSHVIQKTLMRSLERRGFRVTLANHGQDGLNKMKENTYGVVLLDMNMPVMDGFECCRRLREHESSKRQLLGSNKHQFVIGISANNTESTEAYAMEAGMDAFLTKPFSVDSFCELYQKHGAFL